MLYHILYPLHQIFSGFNVFRYITFRAIGATVTALVLCLLVGPAFVRWLKRLHIGQVIRQDGPQTHFSKQGVPTMGGLLILGTMVISTLLWANLTNIHVWLLLGTSIWFGATGAVDDLTKLRRRHSNGLSARGKLLFQFLGAGLVMIFLYQHSGFDTRLSIPLLKQVRPDINGLYIPFAILVIVGSSNAVNLTDGLDGLAIGPTIITGATYLVFSYLAGHAILASYLNLPYIPGSGEIAVFCGAMVGASLGFLWFNAYPAQMFMGDVGSLSLGAALGTIAVIVKQEMLLAIVGGVFVMEALSVILQVGYFKMSNGKRIFLMAPFHHHFEQKGWVEPKVVVRFWIVSIMLGLLALATLKIR